MPAIRPHTRDDRSRDANPRPAIVRKKKELQGSTAAKVISCIAIFVGKNIRIFVGGAIFYSVVRFIAYLNK